MSVYLIRDLVIKNHRNVLPFYIDEYRIVYIPKQKYFSYLNSDPQINFQNTVIAIEAQTKRLEVGVIRNIGTLLALLRIIKPNNGKISFGIDDPSKPSVTYPLSNYQRLRVFNEGQKKTITREDLILLRKLWPKVDEVYKKDSFSRIRNAIDLIEHSVWSIGQGDSLINLVTGLETLFTTDNQEVSHKIASRLSWFLHPLLEDSKIRKTVFNEAKKLYSYRSTLLHGGDVSRFNRGYYYFDILAFTFLRSSIIKILRDERNEGLFHFFMNKKSELLESYYSDLLSGEISIKYYLKFSKSLKKIKYEA